MDKKNRFLRNSYNELMLLRERELGFKRFLGYDDYLTKLLMTSMSAVHSGNDGPYGGIFNLEFSLDGSILTAACERKAILLYDALNQKLIQSVPNAHDHCVNCVTFIDHFAFATGSDDNIIKTWDTRNLKIPSLTLRGHSNWVKNIEYSKNNKRLLTSAFDGIIYSWDLNNYTENSVVHDRVFAMDGLMRMKLSPDGKKLLMCTTQGYILVIHDVNFETMSAELTEFKPHVYRLMQESEQNIPIATCSNGLFSPHRKTNRVEMISDFPNTSEVISSLQIHPMGWCTLTRNISSDELSEWTCVHDIQERDIDDYLNSYTLAKIVPPSNPAQSESESNQNIPQNTLDLWIGLISNRTLRAQRITSERNRNNSADTQRHLANISMVESGILRRYLATSGGTDDGCCKIVQNLSRLTHFMAEPNAGKGFIKELSFSPDGRVICSPFNCGVRLLTFNEECNELSMCVPNHPQELHVIADFSGTHQNIVVSCKFNPYNSLLVSGCLGGHIKWYRPLL